MIRQAERERLYSRAPEWEITNRVSLKGVQVSLMDVDFTNIGLGPARKITARIESANEQPLRISGSGRRNGENIPTVLEHETFWVQLDVTGLGPIEGKLILDCYSVFEQRISRQYRITGDARVIATRQIAITRE